MMAALVIHFGNDNCHRISVLRGAGYCVEECLSVPRLRFTLTELPKPDAVAFAECDEIAELEGREADEAISLIRSSCKAPIILFQSRNRRTEVSAYDLVVPPLTNPRDWLHDVASLIEQSHAARGASEPIRARSVFHRQVARIIGKSRQDRQRSALNH
jgi:hypothetical protein